MIEIFLQAQQNLIRIHRLDQIIGNFRTNRFLHDKFLLTFGNHNDRNSRFLFLHFRKGLQTAHTGHIFVQKNNIKIVVLKNIYRIPTVIAGGDTVIFLFQKQDMRFQKINFVVNPKYFYSIHSFISKSSKV
ncbi:hypothetical protein D3C80_1438620 [compost metagenome]